MEAAIIWAVVWAAIGLLGWVVLYFGGAILGGIVGSKTVEGFDGAAGGGFLGALVGWVLGLILGVFALIQVIINIITAIQIGAK